MLQHLCQAVFCVCCLGACGHLHGHQEAQNHARNGRVNTGFEEERPGDNAQGQQQNPCGERLEVQHGLTAVCDEREKGEGDECEEQVFAVEVIGVENRDNADRDQVVDHSQGQQEDTHRRGEESTHGGENRHRKRNIGCGGDSPAVQGGGAAKVNGRVDNCGHCHATEGSGNRHNSGGRRLEVTDHEFLLQLQAGEEEENDEQAVRRPGADAHLQVVETGDDRADHGVSQTKVEGGGGGVGEYYCQHRCDEQDGTADGFCAQNVGYAA